MGESVPWHGPPDGGEEFAFCVRRLQEMYEHQEPGDWRTLVLASWASSMLEVYTGHLRHLATAQYVAEDKRMLEVLRGYLAGKASSNQKSSNMRQIICACRLCEELELVAEFIPKGIWRMVRGKDRLAGRGRS